MSVSLQEIREDFDNQDWYLAGDITTRASVLFTKDNTLLEIDVEEFPQDKDGELLENDFSLMCSLQWDQANKPHTFQDAASIMGLDPQSKIWELNAWEPETKDTDENYSLEELFTRFNTIESGRCNAVVPLTFHVYMTHPEITEDERGQIDTTQGDIEETTIWKHLEVEMSFRDEDGEIILVGMMNRGIIMNEQEEIYLTDIIDGFKLDVNAPVWECEDCS
jgi:hypothetical protein